MSFNKYLVCFIIESAADRFGRVIRAGYNDGKITHKDVIKYFKNRGWKTLYVYLILYIYRKSKQRKRLIVVTEKRRAK